MALLAAGSSIDLVPVRWRRGRDRSSGLAADATTGTSRRGRPRHGLLPLQQRRRRRPGAPGRGWCGAPADPRLGRAPRQRHPALLRGRSVGALRLDSHQYPFYPGTGASRRGRAGRRAWAPRFNVPLPAGCGDDEYEGADLPAVVLAPCRSRHFRPEMRAGLVRLRRPPATTRWGTMRVTERRLRARWRPSCSPRPGRRPLRRRRLVFLLEGGYALSRACNEGTAALLDALLDARALRHSPATVEPWRRGSRPRSHRSIQRVAEVHGAPDSGPRRGP